MTRHRRVSCSGVVLKKLWFRRGLARRVLARAALYVFSWRSKALLRECGAAFGDGLQLFGAPIVSLAPGSKLNLGKRVVLCSDSRYTALGVSHPVVIRTLSDQAVISIGDDSGLSGSSICAATSVTIGRECLIGADVIITDTDFHPLTPAGRRYARQQDAQSKPVTIGNNVFLGARTIVLKGVSIGDDTVIGAGSVVAQDIAAGVIAAGNPCRVLRSLDGCR